MLSIRMRTNANEAAQGNAHPMSLCSFSFALVDVRTLSIAAPRYTHYNVWGLLSYSFADIWSIRAKTTL